MRFNKNGLVQGVRASILWVRYSPQIKAICCSSYCVSISHLQALNGTIFFKAFLYYLKVIE